MDWNHLNNFERGPTKDHSCEVLSKSNQWFRRTCLLKKLFTDAGKDAPRTMDKMWSQKLTLSLCDRWAKKKKGPKILRFDLWWPPDMPLGKMFASLYSTLHYIWFDMEHDYVCTKWILDPLGPQSPGPAPRGNIKILNMYLQSSSMGLSPVKVSRF